MQVRRVELLGLIGSLGIGGALAPTMLHGEPARLLATFLGLVSASILPTISLILGSMTPGGRSVSGINRLERELALGMDALFVLLGSVGVVFASLFMLGVPSLHLFNHIPYLNDQILPRLGQALVVGGTTLILLRAGQVPAILRRSLKIRHEIAVDEAKKKTLDNVAKIGDPKKLFSKDPNFGRSIPLAELQRPKQ